ncbi:phosphate acetyltransferase [uncultured Maricaulis sp.]|uniref:phosphate acetyltransferase n=1 Tax=uncultured Maricaulis sp. TaxID=174710 RepID=UPI00260BEF3D|nr:phosphate acetyltransferase [uncultured Maricaulis sp.]
MSAPLKLGQSAMTQRAFSEQDAAELHALTGAPLTDNVVPEALINGLFSYLLGVDLPGEGTNYLKQESRFLAPAPLGEPLTARVEITRLRPDKQLVDLATTCVTTRGQTIAEGRALVLARDVAGAFDNRP